MGRRVIDGCHESILARLGHFCGIYGVLSAGRWPSGSPAFRFSLGEAIPWVPEVFFSLGATELSGEAAKSSREAARKITSGTNG